MSKIELMCEECGESFLRERGEHNRNLKKKRRVFCSLACTGKGVENNLGTRLSRGNSQYLLRGRKLDQYSPFRAFHKMVRARHKKFGYEPTDITLEFLKELWDNQDGRCPITGWKMVLPPTTTDYAKMVLEPKTASLDRIVPGKPYTKNNVRFVCYMGNVCRHTFTDEDVRMFAEAVINKIA